MQKRPGVYLVFMFMITVLIGCNDPEAFDCIKSAGQQIDLDISVDPFNKIEINDDIDVFLQNGPETKIILSGGENLLPNVNIVSEDRLLKVENKNTCNWTRNYDRIKVYITSPQINEIFHYGFGNIVSLDTLKAEWLHVKGQWCAGDINLTIETQYFFYVSNAVSQVNIAGNTMRAQLGSYFNDGIYDGELLQADTVLIDHKGYSRMRVKVKDNLKGQILQNGTLEYISENPSLNVDVQGNGKLIKL